MTPHLQELVIQRKTSGELRPAALEDGMIPLRQFGWMKVIEGVTTVDEVMRVTTSDVESND